MSRRVLVFGATGQLGRELARRSDDAVRVVALDRAEASLDRPERAAEWIPASGAEVVVNAAAYTAVDRAEDEAETAYQVNAVAPGVLARACRDLGVPFVHVSTDYVFAGDRPGPWREEDETGPLNVYGRSKLAGEEAVRASGARAVTVRTSWVFSAHGRNFVRTMLALRGKAELSVVDDQIGRPTSAGDLATFLLRVAVRAVDEPQADLGTVLHFANAGATTWRRFADAIFDRLGAPRPVVRPVPTSGYPTAARRPANSELDSTRAEQMYGVRPRRWEAALDDVIAELTVPGVGR